MVAELTFGETVLIEFLKALFVAVFIAGVAGLVVARYQGRSEAARITLATHREEARVARETESKLLASLLERLDSIYRRVKETRQRLGLLHNYGEKASLEMWNMRAEMEHLEQLAKDIELHKHTIPGLEDIHSNVRTMDAYVGECWKEYKKSPTGRDGNFEDRVSKFVADAVPDEGDFQDFGGSYQQARWRLVELLIAVQDPQDDVAQAGRSRRRAPPA
jgi:hypothetical protein